MSINNNHLSTNQCTNFKTFLLNNKSQKGENFTHTRIGDKKLDIYGGSYNIDDNKNVEFSELYYEHVFINNQQEYLTERQFIEDGPLLVDLDLRFDNSIKTRQHTREHIIDLIILYANKLTEIFKIEDSTKIKIYVLEKPNINIQEDKVKDGIHLIFNIKMHKAEQVLLRKLVMKEINNMWDNISFINNYEEIFDEGVTRGFVNWQMYGSQKPGNERYELSYCFDINYYLEEDNWSIKQQDIKEFNKNLKKNLHLLSARNRENQRFEIKNESKLKEIEEIKKTLSNRDSKKMPATLTTNIDINLFDLSKINNQTMLDELVDKFIEEIAIAEYEIKETHQFTMVLPKSYYSEGSYNNWIRVGWALKNTHEKLFLTWMKFSSQSKTFDFSEIPNYYAMWKSFNFKNQDGLTNRSIMFWAKTDNLTEYQAIRQETISYYIEQTLQTMILKDKVTEFDLATVLYQLFKDQFICVSIKNNQWYEYKNYKWNEIDSGNTLRILISKKMHDIYFTKTHELTETIWKKENNDENTENLKMRSKKLGDICILLKTTSWKNNIMKEAKELFYDKDFINKLDANPYLLCFNNYVVDFKTKTHRKGRPDDFISKSTNIDYIPYNNLKSVCKQSKKSKYESIVQDIEKFMDELFPDTELNKYMWQHLASVLIGTNENQTFNIYTGSGANGKSKLVELMAKGLGDYKATVPITLITQSRNTIGSTSSEIVQLMGVRYAVMQEPSKGDKINEGIMKEITGGDPIQGRALFKDTVTFIPQFKLVVCTNVLFDIKSNDDGTWRRIRICDFMSKFTDKPYENLEKFPRENFPYQYQIDTKIDEKFESWAPVFISMLCNIAFETQGKVKDAKIVLAISDKYREGQDYLTEFAKEKISRERDGKIKKTELLEEFKNWYIMHYGRNTIPNGKEITDYMNKQYGKCVRGKWANVVINYEMDDSDDDDDNNDDNDINN